MSHAAQELIVTWMWIAIPSAICGAAAASSKNAKVPGAILGFLFGPLGLIAAFGLDEREICPTCHGRLNGQPQLCMHCRSELYWRQN